jgi:WD40 repeat protein
MSRITSCLALAGLLNVLPFTPVAAQSPASDQYGDPLPAGARARLGTVRLRHGGPVAFVAFSPDGKLLASGSGGGILISDVATGKVLHRLPGGLHGPSSAAFFPDGKSFALFGSDRTLYLWDVNTGRKVRSLSARADTLNLAALSPDGKTVALLDNNHTIRLWDAAADKGLRQLAGPANPQNGKQQPFAAALVTFSPDGKLLAVAGTQGQSVVYRLWEVGSGRERPALVRPSASLTCLALSADGKTLALGEPGPDVLLLDLASGAKTRVPAELRGSAQGLAFAPDGKTLAVINRPGIDLVDRATGKLLRRFRGPAGGYFSVALSPDGKTLAGGGADHVIQLWDVTTGKELRPTPGHRGPVTAAVYSPDGRTVATAGADPAARLWDAATGKELLRLSRPREEGEQGQAPPALLAFLGSGRVLTAAWNDGIVCAWETATGKPLPRVGASRKGHRPLAFSPDGQALATLGPDGLLRVHAVLSGRELRRFGGFQGAGQPGARVPVVAFAPDSRTLATAEGGQGQLGGRLNINSGYIAGTPSAGLVRLWELTSGRERGQVSLASGGSPFGHVWVSGSDAVRDLTFVNPTSSVSLLVLSPDGRALAALFGGSLRLVDLDGNRELRRLEVGYSDGATLAFSPDGRVLAQGGHAELTLWDVATGAELCRMPGHRGAITSVAFSPDGKSLVSGASDTTALVWDVKGLLEEGRRQRLEPSPERLEALWADLAAADAARAYRAVWALAAAPGRSVPFLGARLRPVPAVDGKKLARLVADLDKGRYALRQQAVRELQALGDLAESALRAALEGEPSLELRRRVEALLEKVEAPVTSPEGLRALRAVEALERAGTAEARAALARLAGGAPQARLTREAQGALKRLERRAAAP